MSAERKTPRTDASVAVVMNLVDRDDVISSMRDDMQALEIETQELAEALEEFLLKPERFRDLDKARAALTRHRANQEAKS